MKRKSDVIAELASMLALTAIPPHATSSARHFENPAGTRALKTKKKAARKQARRQRRKTHV